MANTDDDPAFIRAVTSPRKGIGKVSLQQLGNFANEQGVSLWAAVPSFLLLDRLNSRQHEALQGFHQFISRLLTEVDYRGVQAAEFLQRLVGAIQYEHYLFDQFEERAAQARWQNVLDLLEWLKAKLVDDELSILELVQHVRSEERRVGKEWRARWGVSQVGEDGQSQSRKV